MARPTGEVMGTETRELPCRMSERQRQRRALELAAVTCQLGDVQRERKEALARFREQAHELRERVQELAWWVDCGHEPREVECQLVRDLAAGQLRVVRRDTGEIVEERPLTAADLQDSLFRGVPEGDGSVPSKGDDDDEPPRQLASAWNLGFALECPLEGCDRIEVARTTQRAEGWQEALGRLRQHLVGDHGVHDERAFERAREAQVWRQDVVEQQLAEAPTDALRRVAAALGVPAAPTA